ncbi:MAG: hypothetical protein ACYDA4_13330 [Ignavibacteriaceae bacterium]
MQKLMDKYYFSNKSYRPLAVDFLAKRNYTPDKVSILFYEEMLDSVMNDLSKNFSKKFNSEYLAKRPPEVGNKFYDLFIELDSNGKEEELQKFIDDNFSDLREFAENCAITDLNSLPS